MKSVAAVVVDTADRLPDRRALAAVRNGSEISEEYSYRELVEKMRLIAEHLSQHPSPGDRVLLLFPPGGLDFCVAFLSCVYAGVIPVPVYPPYGRQLHEVLGRLVGIVKRAEPTAVLLNNEVMNRGGAYLTAMPEFKDMPSVVINDLQGESEREVADVAPESPCFLQFTSGSTGDPKGVIISHGNLDANQNVIGHALGHNPGLIGVNWLPLYHDMGLIGHLLHPLFIEGTVYFMSPMDFLKKPIRWLQAISTFRAHTSGAPNFALDLCCRRIKDEDIEGLDLSSWTALPLGGEPIRGESLRRFADKFASVGFSPRTYFPCFGLAESTLFVTGVAVRDEPNTRSFAREGLGRGEAIINNDSDAQELVGCGVTAPGHKIKIIEVDGAKEIPDSQIGEICTTGPSVSRGYWNDPENSERLFVEVDGEKYLRTGDLGFVYDGELFVAGRNKDLIIVDGRNLYPQDIEFLAESGTQNIRPGCTASFSVDDGQKERVVLLAEVERRDRGSVRPKMPGQVRSPSKLLPGFDPLKPGYMSLGDTQKHVVSLVNQHFQIPIEFIPVIPGSLPKTSSGKIRRRRARELYLADELELFSRQTLAPAHKTGKS